MQRKTIPETAGFNKNPWANFGIVKNQGFDASLEMNKSFGKDFFLSLRGNFTFSRNKILEYDESEAMKQTTRARTGNPLNTYYAVSYTHLDVYKRQIIGSCCSTDITYHNQGNQYQQNMFQRIFAG